MPAGGRRAGEGERGRVCEAQGLPPRRRRGPASDSTRKAPRCPGAPPPFAVILAAPTESCVVALTEEAQPSRAGTCSGHTVRTELPQPGALTGQGTGCGGTHHSERWRGSQKVGSGQPCRSSEGTAPEPQGTRSLLAGAHLSGIQLGGRTVRVSGPRWPGGCVGRSPGPPLPREPAGLQRRGGPGGGINEMPLGANNSLIGVSGRAAPSPCGPPRLVRISN